MHPARQALAGRASGELFDRLAELHISLQRGEAGIDKPLSCSQSTLRYIAERRPDTIAALSSVPGMDDARADRFGAAFLEAIHAD